MKLERMEKDLLIGAGLVAGIGALAYALAKRGTVQRAQAAIHPTTDWALPVFAAVDESVWTAPLGSFGFTFDSNSASAVVNQEVFAAWAARRYNRRR